MVKLSCPKTIHHPPERSCTYMITYKQLSLADIFTDCQNKFDNGKYEFLSILDLPHKLKYPSIECAAWVYFDCCYKAILIIGWPRDILSVMVNDNAHKLIITQQLNIQCTFRCKHINHYIGVWSYIKIFKLSTPCC